MCLVWLVTVQCAVDVHDLVAHSAPSEAERQRLVQPQLAAEASNISLHFHVRPLLFLAIEVLLIELFEIVNGLANLFVGCSV